MIKKCHFLFLFLFLHTATIAQKEATHSCFGDKAGLYFIHGLPRLLQDGQLRTHRGCASISDKETGQLLFYTNGRNIWNRDPQPMPLAQNFPDDCSGHIILSALIVPDPISASRYYVLSIFLVRVPRLPLLTIVAKVKKVFSGFGDIQLAVKSAIW